MREATIGGLSALDDTRPRKSGPSKAGQGRAGGKKDSRLARFRRFRSRAALIVGSAGFSAIMIGIVLNATVMQKGHHPAPLFAGAAASPPRQVVAAAPDPAPPAPMAAPTPDPIAAMTEAPPAPAPAPVAPPAHHAPRPNVAPHAAAAVPHAPAGRAVSASAAVHPKAKPVDRIASLLAGGAHTVPAAKAYKTARVAAPAEGAGAPVMLHPTAKPHVAKARLAAATPVKTGATAIH